MHYEIAPRIHFEPVCTLDAKGDEAWIGSRAYDEIVLKFLLVAVINEVNAGVDIAVVHAGVCGNIRPPLRGIIADEVVGLAGLLGLPGHARVGASAEENHAQRRPRHLSRLLYLRARGLLFVFPKGFRLHENEDRLAGREKERVHGTAGEELHFWIGLPSVGLKR